MIKKTLFLLVSVALVCSASAAWKKVDDYEDPATLANWSVTSTGLDVDPAIVPGKVEYVDDPVASGQGKVLSIVNPIGTATGSNSSMTYPLGDAAIKDDIANPDKKQTVYFKLLRPLVGGLPGELNTTIGFMSSAEWATSSGVTPPVNEEPSTIPSWGQYSSIVRYETDGIFDIRDGGTYWNISDTAQDTDVWYEVWMVHSHGNGTYQVYLKGGNDYPEQTLVTNEVIVDPETTQFAGNAAAYRVVTFEDLDWFFIKPNGGGTDAPEGKDNTYIDDFYIDNDGENLSSPAGGSGGAWTKVDDFEGYADQAALDAVWNFLEDADEGEGGGGLLVEDPYVAGNMVLQINHGFTTAETGSYNTRVSRHIDGIPNTGITTMYWRFGVPSVLDGEVEVDGVVDCVMGLSPVADPSQYSDYSPMFRQEFDGSMDFYNLDTYTLILETLPGSTWYEVWFVLDADNRSYDAWIKGGLTYLSRTQVVDDFGWRNQTLEALQTMVMTTSAGTLVDPKGLDALLVDDIYMAPGQELTNPVGGEPNDPLIGGTPIPNLPGWYLSEWFGAYNTDLAPWIFHGRHGWLYRDAPSSSESGMYVYDDKMTAWWFTSQTQYPYIYGFNTPADNAGTVAGSAWLWYFNGTKTPRNFAVVTGPEAGNFLYFNP